jgi:hypothetical protein
MKKTLLLSALAIALLTSCGTTTTSNGSTTSADWFEFNGTRFEAQQPTSLIVNGFQGISATWYENKNGNIQTATVGLNIYNKDSVMGIFSGTVSPGILVMSYKTPHTQRTTRNGFSNPNSAKTVNIVKNPNGTYTVTGQYYMYEAYDSTKRHTIKLNFTTK